VYIHLNLGASEYTRKSPCIFTLNQNHNGIFTEFPCPFLTVHEFYYSFEAVRIKANNYCTTATWLVIAIKI
jgi:hypothetical protein